MNEDRQDTEIQLDLWKLLQLYLKKWWFIMLAALVVAGGTLAYTYHFVQPQYRASVTIYVNNNSNNEKQEYVSSSDLSTSQRLVNTYTNMLTSNTVLKQVIDATDLDCTPTVLRGMISAEQVDETEIFKVYVRNTDPVLATTIANAIAQTAPEVIAEFVEGSSTKIIDYAEVPTGRYTPSYKKNTVIGFLVGAALAAMLLAIQFLLDVRIKEEGDLRELFSEIPVLGQIPDLDQRSAGGNYGAYKKYAGYTGYGGSAAQSAVNRQEEKTGEKKHE